jgi:hypothetical protein
MGMHKEHLWDDAVLVAQHKLIMKCQQVGIVKIMLSRIINNYIFNISPKNVPTMCLGSKIGIKIINELLVQVQAYYS